MKCEKCSNEFEAERNTARFCSDKCKKAAQRKKVKDHSAELDRLVKVLEDEGRSANEINDILDVHQQDYEIFGKFSLPNRLRVS